MPNSDPEATGRGQRAFPRSSFLSVGRWLAAIFGAGGVNRSAGVAGLAILACAGAGFGTASALGDTESTSRVSTRYAAPTHPVLTRVAGGRGSIDTEPEQIFRTATPKRELPQADAPVLFVGGRTSALMFRVDFRNASLSTTEQPKLLTGVVAAQLSDTVLWVCHALPAEHGALKLVGFELESGRSVQPRGHLKPVAGCQHLHDVSWITGQPVVGDRA